MVELRNYTPHKIVLFSQCLKVLKVFESEGNIRVQVFEEKSSLLGDIPLYISTQRRDNDALPPQIEGVYYIVSSKVLDAYPDREDFIAPNTSYTDKGAVRDESGAILGVKSFVKNN